LVANIPDLQYGRLAQALLNLQVEAGEVRGPEILAHCEQVESGSGGASRVGANRNSREDLLVCLPGVGTARVCGDRERTKWIALDTLRRSDGRAEIQEGIHVDLIEIDAKSSAHHQIAPLCRLISKTQAGREVIVVGWEDRIRNRQLSARR